MTADALPPDLLQRPAPEGARLVTLGYLDQAMEAFRRLDDPADSEALHDFRVALRRMRSTIRAYRPLLADSVAKRQRGRLRDLGDQTNAGRDAEVQVAWLREHRGRITTRERTGVLWLIERLEERRQGAYGEALDAVRREFPPLERRLRIRLGEYRAQVPAAGEPPPARFRASAAEALGTSGGALVESLSAVQDPADAVTAHAARIAAKRVRYVLEPLAERCPGGPALVRRLKSLQDLLGEANDCHVLEAEVATAAAAAGADRARRHYEVVLAAGADAGRRALRSGRDPRPGLLAVARLLRARRRELFARLQKEWLADDLRGFAAELAEASGALAGRGARRTRSTRRARGRGGTAARRGAAG